MAEHKWEKQVYSDYNSSHNAVGYLTISRHRLIEDGIDLTWILSLECPFGLRLA